MLFKCERCDCVDSTQIVDVNLDGYICTDCSTGEWHHLFDKERYDPSIHKDIVNVTNPVDEYGSEPSFS